MSDVVVGEGHDLLDLAELATVLPDGLIDAGGHQPADRVESRRFRATYASVGAARAFARKVAWRWRVEDVSEDLVTVVSELVANALDHALDGEQVGVDLQLVGTPTRLACVVSDPVDRPPRRLAPDPATESGRGLILIDSLSESWGWTPLSEVGFRGKAVWAVLAVPGCADRE